MSSPRQERLAPCLGCTTTRVPALLSMKSSCSIGHPQSGACAFLTQPSTCLPHSVQIVPEFIYISRCQSAKPVLIILDRPAPRAPSDRPQGVKMGGGFRPVTVFRDHEEELLASTIHSGLSLLPHSSGLRPPAPPMPIRTPRGFNVKKVKPKRPNTFFV